MAHRQIAFVARSYELGHGLGRERIEVLGFTTAAAAGEFLARNSIHDGRWREYRGELAPGVHASIAGAWRELRTIPATLRAHV